MRVNVRTIEILSEPLRPVVVVVIGGAFAVNRRKLKRVSSHRAIIIVKHMLSYLYLLNIVPSPRRHSNLFISIKSKFFGTAKYKLYRPTDRSNPVRPGGVCSIKAGLRGCGLNNNIFANRRFMK